MQRKYQVNSSENNLSQTHVRVLKEIITVSQNQLFERDEREIYFSYHSRYPEISSLTKIIQVPQQQPNSSKLMQSDQ